jgi:hypothetical protein
LQPPNAERIAQVLADFWEQLARLPDLLVRNEQLLAAELTHTLRTLVLEMMLALNGIRPPEGTAYLNTYLSASQRSALQKTLTVPTVSSESWIGCAVALVVIYRWYAPQLVARFGCRYPQEREAETVTLLQSSLVDWPLDIVTD